MALKRLMFAAFVAFLSSAATIVVMGRLAPEGAAPARVVSAAELARHASASDCWMAIGGSVYALTDYVPAHPTPPAVMTRWCGKDATQAFETKGGAGEHSAAAREMLASYRVGALR